MLLTICSEIESFIQIMIAYIRRLFYGNTDDSSVSLSLRYRPHPDRRQKKAVITTVMTTLLSRYPSVPGRCPRMKALLSPAACRPGIALDFQD